MCELLNQLNRERKALEVRELSSRCRYHRKKSEKFSHDTILRKFRCLELFHAIYPKVLGLMYDARFSEDELVINCPNSENTVTVRLYTQPVKGMLRCLWNKAKELLHPLRPMDIIKVVVNVKVLSVKGVCLARYKAGDTFEIPHRDTICPQALYSIFPLLLLPSDKDSCQCPSNVNRVVYQECK